MTNVHRWTYSIDMDLGAIRRCRDCGAVQRYQGDEWIDNESRGNDMSSVQRSYDLIDDPVYKASGLSVSTCNPLTGHKRQFTHWGVYYHGRLLHPHLSTSTEARTVQDMYEAGVPATDARWRLLTTPGKKPSPSTDHLRKAGLA